MTTEPTPSASETPHSASERADVLEFVNAGFRYAFSLTNNRHDAEDLVQQACLKVVRQKGSIVERGYLFVTIRNLFVDRCRRQSVLSFSPLKEEANGDGASCVHQIDSRLDVETILATLSERERELIYLNCIEGFSAQEISEITGQPRGTILSLLSRSRKKLTARFQVERCEKGAAR